MDGRHHTGLLDCFPQAVVLGRGEVVPLEVGRPQDDDSKARLDDALQLSNRVADGLDRQDGRRDQPLGGDRGEVLHPVVVGARQRPSHVGILDQREVLAEQGREQDLTIDAHRIEIGEPGTRIRGTGIDGAVLPEVRGGDVLLRHARTPDGRSREPTVGLLGDPVSVQDREAAVLVLFVPEARPGQRAVFGVQVLEPQRSGLEDVAVEVDDVHLSAPRSRRRRVPGG